MKIFIKGREVEGVGTWKMQSYDSPGDLKRLECLNCEKFQSCFIGGIFNGCPDGKNGIKKDDRGGAV